MRTLLRDLGTVSGVQCACIVRGGQVLATTFPESEAVAQAASLGFVRGISDGLELVDRGLEELQVDFQGRSLMVAPVAKDFVLAMLAAPDSNTQLLRVVMGSSVRQLRRMHEIPEKAEPATAAPQPAAARPGAPPPPPSAAAPKPGAAPTSPVPPRPQPAAPPPPQGAKPAPTGRPQPPPPPGRPAAPPPPPPPGRPAAGQPQPAKPAQPAAAQATGAQATAAQAPKPGASGAPAGPGAKPATPASPPAAAAPKPAEKDAEPVLPQVLALLTEYIGPVARVSFKRGVTRWRETSTPTVGTLNELAKILAADLSTDSEKKAFMDAVDRLRGS